MDVTLGGEVEPRSHVSPGRADPGGVPRIEPVNGGALLFVGLGLNVALEVGPDLPEQGCADPLRNRQFLRPRHPILLEQEDKGQMWMMG